MVKRFFLDQAGETLLWALGGPELVLVYLVTLSWLESLVHQHWVTEAGWKRAITCSALLLIRATADVMQRAQAPTVSKDVAPIFYKHLVSCHRAGEIASHVAAQPIEKLGHRCKQFTRMSDFDLGHSSRMAAHGQRNPM